MKQVIQLNEDYAISCDDLNILLHERKVNQKEGTKNFGKEYYSVIGYYSSVESLLKGLINKQIQLSISEQTTLESLVKQCRNVH